MQMTQAAVSEYIAQMLRKVASGKVTREEGTMLLNDAVTRYPGEVWQVMVDLCRRAPVNVYVTTIIHTMVLTGNKYFMKVLEACVDDEREEVAVRAAEGLAELGGEDVMDILLRHMGSDNYRVRMNAARVIVDRFGRQGIERLIEYAENSDDSMYIATAVDAAGKNPKYSVGVYLKLITTSNLVALEYAVACLLRHGSKGLVSSDFETLKSGFENLVKGERYEGAKLIMKIMSSARDIFPEYEAFIDSLREHPNGELRDEAELEAGFEGLEEAQVLHEGEEVEESGEGEEPAKKSEHELLHEPDYGLAREPEFEIEREPDLLPSPDKELE